LAQNWVGPSFLSFLPSFLFPPFFPPFFLLFSIGFSYESTSALVCIILSWYVAPFFGLKWALCSFSNHSKAKKFHEVRDLLWSGPHQDAETINAQQKRRDYCPGHPWERIFWSPLPPYLQSWVPRRHLMCAGFALLNLFFFTFVVLKLSGNPVVQAKGWWGAFKQVILGF
jgi:hypothetical protein